MVTVLCKFEIHSSFSIHFKTMHYLRLVSIQVSISVVQRVEINSLLQIHTHLRELVQKQRIMHVKSCDICRVIIVFAQGYMLIHTVNICMEKFLKWCSSTCVPVHRACLHFGTNWCTSLHRKLWLISYLSFPSTDLSKDLRSQNTDHSALVVKVVKGQSSMVVILLYAANLNPNPSTACPTYLQSNDPHL